jgi:carboxypeptidase family protein
MHRAALRSFAVLALLLIGAPSFAQITAATISGSIKDDTGGVLPGAEVVARNLETGISRSAVSTADGAFTLAGLPPGKYEVRVALPGFTTSVQNLELAVAQQAGLIVTLKVGATQESVIVTAGAVLVDTQSSTL